MPVAFGESVRRPVFPSFLPGDVFAKKHLQNWSFDGTKVAQTRLTFYNVQRNLSLKNCSRQSTAAEKSGVGED
jgi:hypothetical protein